MEVRGAPDGIVSGLGTVLQLLPMEPVRQLAACRPVALLHETNPGPEAVGTLP